MVSPTSGPSHVLFTVPRMSPLSPHLASFNSRHLLWEAFSDLFSGSGAPLYSLVCVSARSLVLLVIIYLLSWTVSASRTWIMLGLSREMTHSTQWCSEKGQKLPLLVGLQGVNSHDIYCTESRVLQWGNHYCCRPPWVTGVEGLMS